MRKNIIIMIILSLWTGKIFGQTIVPKTPFVVNVDISRFRSTHEKAYVEVNYAVYPSCITLKKNKDTLWGSVVLKIQIFARPGDSVFAQSVGTIPIMIADTALSALRKGFIGKSIYQLPIGNYEIYLVAYDANKLERRDSIRKNIILERPDTRPGFSDIDLCSSITPSHNKSDLFFKNTYEVIPNPSLLFGAKISPVAFSYVEIYNLIPESTYTIVTGIRAGKGEYLKQRSSSRKNSGRNIVDINSLNVHTLPSGKYRYTVTLSDGSGKLLCQAEKEIFLDNPQVMRKTPALLSAKIADFMSMSDDEMILEYRQAKYIISDDEIFFFEKKITTTDGRREFLAKMWNDVESGKYGRTDLSRAIYLDRVNTANQRYRAMGREGWQTDRGRIYILYAEPDEVERSPSSANSKPFEIWHYYQIENGVQFVFADRSGFNDYILVHSTKRGELQDEQWQENLR